MESKEESKEESNRITEALNEYVTKYVTMKYFDFEFANTINKPEEKNKFIKYYLLLNSKKFSFTNEQLKTFLKIQLIIKKPKDEDIIVIKKRKELFYPKIVTSKYESIDCKEILKNIKKEELEKKGVNKQTKGKPTALTKDYCTKDVKKNIIEIISEGRIISEGNKLNILEVFAGNGVASSNLFDDETTKTTVNIKKTDLFKHETVEEIDEIDAISAVSKYKEYETLLMISPPPLNEPYDICCIETFHSNSKSKFLIIFGDINTIKDGSKNLNDYLFNSGKWRLKLYHESLESPNIFFPNYTEKVKDFNNSYLLSPAFHIFEKIIIDVKSDGQKKKSTKRKSFKRKSSKRKSTKRKLSKRKSTKRKSLKRKSSKRKSIKRKSSKRKSN